MWSVQTLPPIQTKFLCLNTEMQLGSFIDGWEVVWCQPDHNPVIWHISGAPTQDQTHRVLRLKGRCPGYRRRLDRRSSQVFDCKIDALQFVARSPPLRVLP